MKEKILAKDPILINAKSVKTGRREEMIIHNMYCGYISIANHLELDIDISYNSCMINRKRKEV